jgi:hypothetical protein
VQDTQRTYIQCFCIIQTQQLSLSRSGDRSEKSIDKRVSTTLSIQITYVRQTNDDRVVQHPRHLQRARDAPCFAKQTRAVLSLSWFNTCSGVVLSYRVHTDALVHRRDDATPVPPPGRGPRRSQYVVAQPAYPYESETHLSEFRSCCPEPVLVESAFISNGLEAVHHTRVFAQHHRN